MNAWIRVVVCLVVSAIGVPAQAGRFVPGELYLHTPAATGISSTSGEMLHVDLVGGRSDLFIDDDGTSSGIADPRILRWKPAGGDCRRPHGQRGREWRGPDRDLSHRGVDCSAQQDSFFICDEN